MGFSISANICSADGVCVCGFYDVKEILGFEEVSFLPALGGPFLGVGHYFIFQVLPWPVFWGHFT